MGHDHLQQRGVRPFAGQQGILIDVLEHGVLHVFHHDVAHITIGDRIVRGVAAVLVDHDVRAVAGFADGDAVGTLISDQRTEVGGAVAGVLHKHHLIHRAHQLAFVPQAIAGGAGVHVGTPHQQLRVVHGGGVIGARAGHGEGGIQLDAVGEGHQVAVSQGGIVGNAFLALHFVLFDLHIAQGHDIDVFIRVTQVGHGAGQGNRQGQQQAYHQNHFPVLHTLTLPFVHSVPYKCI